MYTTTVDFVLEIPSAEAKYCVVFGYGLGAFTNLVNFSKNYWSNPEPKNKAQRIFGFCRLYVSSTDKNTDN